MVTTKKIGWGLIGTGRIAEDRVLPAIVEHAGSRLVGVVSRDPRRARQFAEKFGAEHAYTSYDDLLRNPDVTVVAVHTPNSQHAAQVIAAVRAGKHVFCDKPMATRVTDAENMVRACEKAGVRLGINFHNRFMPVFHEIRRVITSGEIGKPHLVQLEASPGARSGGRLATWRIDPQLAGLGTTYSIGVHVYDILRYLLGAEVEMVSALFDKPRGVMEEMNVSLFRFTNGALAQLSVHENSPLPHNDLVVYGSRGRITGRGVTRSRDGGVLEVTTEDGRSRSQEFPAINAHAACVKGFADALLEGREFATSGIDGLRSVQVTDAMARSAHEGVHVRLAY
jgi:1,5-anhydro-D-fructose reductase (1,5-anhydro-D-mannitol-forming)